VVYNFGGDCDVNPSLCCTGTLPSLASPDHNNKAQPNHQKSHKSSSSKVSISTDKTTKDKGQGKEAKPHRKAQTPTTPTQAPLATATATATAAPVPTPIAPPTLTSAASSSTNSNSKSTAANSFSAVPPPPAKSHVITSIENPSKTKVKVSQNWQALLVRSTFRDLWVISYRNSHSLGLIACRRRCRRLE